MANAEHLARLKEGVDAWNVWCKTHPGISPDLSYADLSHADLSDANLHTANLWHADLHETNLIRADLSHADLREASLIRAILIRATLIRTTLRDADLSDANLRTANLWHADLHGAILIRADLQTADLSEANLSHATLSATNLGGATLRFVSLGNADLSHATLSAADLSGVILIRATLSEADLSHATLSHADLSHATLHAASLSHADLSHATLHAASVSHADLTNVRMWNTTLTALDLSQVKGLETVTHGAPSSIGIDTIYKSRGQIPEVFLRGAGVPDQFIEYMRSLVAANAIEYYSCFISYSSKDEDFARRLYADLQANNVRCWFAPESLQIGEDFWERIDASIRVYDKLLVVLSAHSLESVWVQREVLAALEKEAQQPGRTVLFPVRLDDAVIKAMQSWAAGIQGKRHIGNFCAWKDHDAYQAAFTNLLRDLKAQPG